MSAAEAAPASVPCPRCGEPVTDGFDACWRCGAPVAESLLERDPSPDLDTLLAADRAATAAELQALRANPPRPSLRSQFVGGVLAALVSLSFTTGLLNAEGAAVRRILGGWGFWVALLVHVAVLGGWLGAVAGWRRWQRRRQAGRRAREQPGR